MNNVLKEFIDFFTGTYEKENFYIKKKAQYTIALVLLSFLIGIFVLSFLYASKSAFFFSFYPTILSDLLLFILAIILFKKGKLEFAINLLVAQVICTAIGIVRENQIMAFPMLIVNLTAISIIAVKSYQYYFAAASLAMILIVDLITDIMKKLPKDAITYSIIVFIMFLVFIFFLNIILNSINSEIRKSEELEKANEHINNVNQNLENMVNVRTEELKESLYKLKATQNQLLISEKMVSLGKFAGGIAHEINSPLGATLTSAQLIKLTLEDMPEGEMKAEIKESVETIESSTKKSKAIISKLLNYTEKSERSKVDTNIKDIIAEAILLFDNECKKNDIIVEFDAESEYFINVNPQEILSAINSLFENSIYALTEKNNIEKFIIIKSYVSGGKNILEFFDNGIGIESHIMTKIFDPFFTTKPLGKGMGLGLSLVYDTFRRYEYQVTVESDFGHWTRIRMTF